MSTATRRASAWPRAAVVIADERVADGFTAPGDELERLSYGWSRHGARVRRGVRIQPRRRASDRSRLLALLPPASAAQQDSYREAIEAAGLAVEDLRINSYEFMSERARNASAKYGVKSVSLLARKER